MNAPTPKPTNLPTRPTPEQVEKQVPPPIRTWIEAILNQRFQNLPTPVAPKSYDHELRVLEARIRRIEAQLGGDDLSPLLRTQVAQLAAKTRSAE